MNSAAKPSSLACSVVLLVVLLLVCGCDSVYKIEGKVVVARGAGASVVPAVVCVGKGGPLDSSGIYGHPATMDHTGLATLFCEPAPEDVEFPLREMIIQGRMPRRAHVYAWLEPVPTGKELCAQQGKAMVPIDLQALDRLMSPEDAGKAPGDRAPVDRPCGRKPTPTLPIAYAVTFDPDHETWSRNHVETRVLRIE